MDASPNAIVGVDEAGLITYVNPQVARVFGYASDQLIGRPVEMLIPDRIATGHLGHRNGFVAKPRARPMGIGLDLAGRRLDGTEFPVDISLSPVQAATGLHVYATIVDITARKEAELKLAASESRFRAVLDGTPNAVVAIDLEGQIIYVNPDVELTFGYAPHELLGQPMEVLVPAAARERHVGHRARYNRHPVTRPMGIGLDLSGRRKDGNEFPAEISLSPVKTDDGYEIFAQIVDITGRKGAETELLQAQKLESIGRLAGGIAHDFNNVLFAMGGYAELLEEDLSADGVVDQAASLRSVTAISEAVHRAQDLTSQLLAFSRQQMVEPRVMDLNDAVRGVEPMLSRLIGENIVLSLVLDAQSSRIKADPGQLDQILINLAVNARDAMLSGGTLTIATGDAAFDARDAAAYPDMESGSHVFLAVADTGSGMDRDTKEHIFEPFFTTKERGKGTGLGLATIYGIVRQAGGHIWVYSEPEQGSIFKLYFPRVDEPIHEPPVAPEPDPPPTASGTILLVEDDPAVRDMTAQLLERAGYTVIQSDEGNRALELIQQSPADVLVTDVVMPGMSGIELTERVLEERPGMGVVLLSGYTEETLDLARLRARRVGFVPKPVAGKELFRAVARAFALAESDPR